MSLLWVLLLGAPGLATLAYNCLWRTWRVGGLIPVRLGYIAVGVVVVWLSLRRRAGASARGDGASGPVTCTKARVPGLVVAAAVFAVLSASLVSWLVFDHIPHVQDEVSYFLQAQIFARGTLTAPAPARPEFFDPGQSFLVIREGRWYSLFPPGNAFALSLGLRGGLLWLVNPIFFGLAVLAVYALGRTAYDAPTGTVAALLIAFAPGMVFMASSLMSHTAVLALGAAGLATVFAVEKEPRTGLAALGGLAFGACSLVRPLDGGLLALASAAYLLVVHRRRGLGLSAALLAVFAMVASGYLMWNWAVNGNPLLPGHRVAMPRGVFFGLGRNAYGGQNTLPLLAWSAFRNMAAYADMAWGWPLNLFLALAAYVFLFGSPGRREWFLLSLYGLFVAVFFTYYHPGLCLGARYFWPTYAGMAVLLARMVVGPGRAAESEQEHEQAHKEPGNIVGSASARRMSTVAVAILFCAMAWTLRLPAWAWEYKHDFWKVSADVGKLVDQMGLKRGLIFLHEGAIAGPPKVTGELGSPAARSPAPTERWYNKPVLGLLANTMTGMKPAPRELVFRSGMIRNGAWPDSHPVIYVLDRGRENAEALRLWPDRKSYMVYCDSRSQQYVLCPYRPVASVGAKAAGDQ